MLNKKDRIQGAINFLNTAMANFQGSFDIEVMKSVSIINVNMECTTTIINEIYFNRLVEIMEELYNNVSVCFKIAVYRHFIAGDLAGDLIDSFTVHRGDFLVKKNILE